ncbi:MAG: hypothetical protein ACLU00_00805 [Mediterraneibacter faecis]
MTGIYNKIMAKTSRK